MRKIAILGSTGSIGTQTLEVVEANPERFSVEVLTANNHVDLLIEQALKFHPDSVVIANEEKYPLLRDALQHEDIKVFAGADALAQIVTFADVDLVVTALVGYSGLIPTVNAIKAGKNIALANKEDSGRSRRIGQRIGRRTSGSYSACRFGTFCHLPVFGRREPE